MMLLVTAGMNSKGLGQRSREIAMSPSNATSSARHARPIRCWRRSNESDGFAWPQRDGLKWPHLALVVVVLGIVPRVRAEAMRRSGADAPAERKRREAEAASPEALARAAAQAAGREEQARRKEAESAVKFDGSGASSLSAFAGAAFDHRRTWRFRTTAQQGQCIQGFTDAFEGPSGVVMKAKWVVDTHLERATATYKGRAGITVLATAFSGRARAEEDGAIGSEVKFTVEQQNDGHVICAMLARPPRFAPRVGQ